MAKETEIPIGTKTPTPENGRIFDDNTLRGGKLLLLDGLEITFSRVMKDDKKKQYQLFYGSYRTVKIDYSKVDESLLKDYLC